MTRNSAEHNEHLAQLVRRIIDEAKNVQPGDGYADAVEAFVRHIQPDEAKEIVSLCLTPVVKEYSRRIPTLKWLEELVVALPKMNDAECETVLDSPKLCSWAEYEHYYNCINAIIEEVHEGFVGSISLPSEKGREALDEAISFGPMSLCLLHYEFRFPEYYAQQWAYRKWEDSHCEGPEPPTPDTPEEMYQRSTVSYWHCFEPVLKWLESR